MSIALFMVTLTGPAVAGVAHQRLYADAPVVQVTEVSDWVLDEANLATVYLCVGGRRLIGQA